MIVIACPGQGSQTPGFLSPWLQDPASASKLRDLSTQIGIDLVAHGTQSDAETIKATNIAQPLIVAAGILTIDAFNAALSQLPEPTAESIRSQLVFAGHSVGEISAAYGAGIFDAATALRFVADRANAMQECATASDTGMAAVLGGDEADVLEAINAAGLAPANFNGGGQIVAAGPSAAITDFAANPPAKARVMPLKVAGAFHTETMAAARESLQASRESYAAADPTAKILTNHDGSIVLDGNKYVDLLIHQVAAPVRWDACMQTLSEPGVTRLIECAPSGALAGLARRGMPGVAAVKITSPDDVATVIAELATEFAAKSEG